MPSKFFFGSLKSSTIQSSTRGYGQHSLWTTLIEESRHLLLSHTVISLPPHSFDLSMGFCRYFAIALAASCAVNVLGQTVQKPNLQVPESAAKNKTAVVQIFNESYTAYKCVTTRRVCFAKLTSSTESMLSATTT